MPTENKCQNCFDTAHIEVMMMRITINLSAASIPGLPPEMDICVCCDSALSDMHITPLKRKTQTPAGALMATTATTGGRGGGGHPNAGYSNNSSSSNADTMRNQSTWNPTTPGMPTPTHMLHPTANLGTICSLLYVYIAYSKLRCSFTLASYLHHTLILLYITLLGGYTSNPSYNSTGQPSLGYNNINDNFPSNFPLNSAYNPPHHPNPNHPHYPSLSGPGTDPLTSNIPPATKVCACGLPVKQLTVGKDGPNKGRLFTSCPKPK